MVCLFMRTLAAAGHTKVGQSDSDIFAESHQSGPIQMEQIINTAIKILIYFALDIIKGH